MTCLNVFSVEQVIPICLRKLTAVIINRYDLPKGIDRSFSRPGRPAPLKLRINRLETVWRLIVLTSLLLLLPAASSASPPQKYWVIFRDKGDEQEISLRLDSLKQGWPDRSLKRRQKAGVQVTASDLPLAQEYLAQLAAKGVKIESQSRWINGVSASLKVPEVEQLRALPFVESIRPVAIFTLDQLSEVDEQEAIDFGKEYYPAHELGDYGPSYRQAELAGVVEAHKRGLTGKGVLIGMLDSGFQLDHRALAGMDLVGQYDFIFNDPDPSYDPRTDPKGQASHGTGCLSVIAGYEPGKLVGIAPKASFALGKTEYTGSETRAEEDWWIEGIEWLEKMGADVVSSSLTYRDWYFASELDGETPLVSRAAQRAAELGMIVCISAGNAGPKPITIGAPADAPDVLAVAAADSTGAITRFSSRGPSADGRIKPDIAAMGRKVVCVSPLTYDECARWNGTSLACPIVAGVAALVIEAHPDWSPDKVREALRETASQAFCPDDSAGYGLVDCEEALKYPCISGRVMMEGGEVPNGDLFIFTIESLDSRKRLSDVHFVSSIQIDHFGRFELPCVKDGRYELLSIWVNRKEKKTFSDTREIQVPPSASVNLILKAQP